MKTSRSWYTLAAVCGLIAVLLFTTACQGGVLDEITPVTEAELQRTIDDKIAGDRLALDGAQTGSTVKVVLGAILSTMSALAAAAGVSRRRRSSPANDVATVERVARGVQKIKQDGGTPPSLS